MTKALWEGITFLGVRIVEFFDTFNLGTSFSQEGGICDEEGSVRGAEFSKELAYERSNLR